jgi:SWI/SNF related-matrix-associated actin-dependent regulator of chromatin subfamily C
MTKINKKLLLIYTITLDKYIYIIKIDMLGSAGTAVSTSNSNANLSGSNSNNNNNSLSSTIHPLAAAAAAAAAASSLTTTTTTTTTANQLNNSSPPGETISTQLVNLSTTTQQFEPVRKWLSKHHKKYVEPDPPSNKQLLHFLSQFVQFQEDNLGKNAPQPVPPITRLPIEVLFDFEAGGALCHLFSVVFKYKYEQKITKLDIHQFGKRAQIIEMCEQIEKCLIDNQRLLTPRCFIRTELFAANEMTKGLVKRLEEIIKKHKGHVVDTIEEADHVINPPSEDETFESIATNCNNNNWIRVVRKRGKDLVLIHRYFTPDSQDQWLSNIEIDDDAAGLNDSDSSNEGIWEVTSNWLLHTDIFNEWMNQEDYEVDANASTTDGKVKLKKGPNQRKTLDDIIKKNSKNHQKRSPSPTPPLNKKPKQQQQQQGITRKRKHDETKDSDNSNDTNDLTKSMDAPPVQPHVEEVHIPKSINIKKENSDSRDYQPHRNGTLIDLDEENNSNTATPNSNNEENKDPALTNGHHSINQNGTSNGSTIPFNNNTNIVSNSFSSLSGGVKSMEQIEACEQTHHIIVPSYAAWFDYTSLHEIEKRALPEFFNQKNRSKTAEIYIGYRNFMIDTYRLNPGEYLSATACRRNLPGDVCAIMRVHAFLEQWGLINYQVDYEARAAPLGPPCTSHFTILADTPSGLAPVTGPRPTNSVSASKQLLDMSNKKQVPNAQKLLTTSDDALKTTPTDQSSIDKLNPENFGIKQQTEKIPERTVSTGLSVMRSTEWSDDEMLHLLEGLEMFKDDWNKVCEHVGTRTQDECILKFLQLPIEDPYLDGKEAGASLGALAYQPMPFSQAGNPVMSTVAFLASVVDPRVASAAAKAAISEFSKMKDEVPSQTMNTHLTSVLQSHKDGKNITNNFDIEKTGVAIIGSDDEKKVNAEGESNNESKAEVSAMDIDKTADSAETEKVKKDEDNSTKKDEEAETVPTTTTTTTLSTTTTTTTLSTTTTTTAAAESKPEETPAATKSTSGFSELELKNAAASALAAAAVKARQLALNEEKKIKNYVTLLVEIQLKKLEIKLKHFEELEAIMDKERENLDHQRQQLLQERQQFHLEQLRAAEVRQRQIAAQQLLNEGKLTIPPPNPVQQSTTAEAPKQPEQSQPPQTITESNFNKTKIHLKLFNSFFNLNRCEWKCTIASTATATIINWQSVI